MVVKNSEKFHHGSVMDDDVVLQFKIVQENDDDDGADVAPAA